MAVATLANLEKTFGRRVLFDKLSLTVYDGDRIGLIGDNGTGKTSLFKALVGGLVPDAGTVSLARGTRIGYLEQDPVFDPANNVIDEAELAFAELHRLSHRMRDIEHEMAHLTGDALDKALTNYQNVTHDFELAGGYAWRHRLEATLLGVGLETPTWEQNVTTLSGGQRSRLALAKVLIAEPDLLLLDEPTNHLDLAAIEWVENYLLRYKGAVLLISHDRFLLDRLSTRIAWLHACKLDSFNGNYTAYLDQRELIELSQQRAYESQQADIEKQQEFIRRFGAGQRSKEARGRKTRLERFLKSDSVVQQVENQNRIRLNLDTDQRSGDQVLQVRELGKAYDGRALWTDLRFSLGRGDRVGIIGPNGSGKTTLLEVLLGGREADAGEIKWGASLNIGYYDQKLGNLKPNNKVMEEVREGTKRSCSDQELRDVLAMMLFRGADADKPVHQLSGGERARVRMCQLLLDRPNVLVLDEPTNHLDIASREALEAALDTFTGTLLCVSHDRYFLDRVVARMFVLSPPGMEDFSGNYSQWQAKQREVAEARAAAAEAARRPPPKPSQKRAPQPQMKSQAKLRKENPYKRPFGSIATSELEKEIARAERALSECQSRFNDPAVLRDAGRARELQGEQQDLAGRLKKLEEEYYLRDE